MTKKSRLKRKTLFDYVNLFIMILFCITVIYPFWYLLVISFETPMYAAGGGIHLWFQDFTLKNYSETFSNSYIWVGYRNTIIITVAGTVIQLFFTAMSGYALSKKYFPNRNFWTFFIVFTMFFSGGLIPSYLLIRTLDLFDTYTVLILPGLISAYNLVMMRNFFMSLPEEIEESCMVDGAGRFTIFFRIVIPVSTPILATVGLWLAVGHWNSWFNALIYMRSNDKFTLPVVLRQILLIGQTETLDDMDMEVSREGLKAATIFTTTVPILCLYPFLQKYFVKGIMVGSLKG